MSRENVEVVRRGIEGHHSEALDARREQVSVFWHQVCEYTSVVAALESATYRGHDGIRDYLNDLATPLRKRPEWTRSWGYGTEGQRFESSRAR